MSWLKSWLFRDGQGSIGLLRRLLADYGLRYFKLYAAAYLLMGIAGACTGLTAYMAGNAANAAYVYQSFDGVIAVCVAIIVIFTVKGLSSYGQSVLLARIANAITAENQRRSFDKVLQESVGFFADRHSSEFMARVTFGASAAASVLNLVMTTFGRDLIALLSLATVMITQDPFLSLIGLLLLPPSLLAVRKLMKRVQHIMLTQFTGSARILEIMQETIQGLRIIKAFNLEPEMRSRIYQSVADVERASNKIARVSNRSSPLMEVLGGFAVAFVFLYAGYRVLETGAAPGEFFAFITAFLLAYEPAKRIARFNIDLSTSIVGVQILYELLDSPPTEPEEHNKPALIVNAGKVQFSSVNFSYRPGEPVLREMSLVADAGKVTALVGHSGGGKSTTFNLLLRFYEAQGGAITIDGTDIFTTSRSSLRQQIAYVGQDIFLFKGTIRENIALGRIDADEETVVAAAKAAFAHEFITTFPLGYATPVGEHGVQLSLGQRQRIAVARALIKNAPIILLDEPTASLDSESERKVHEAISRLCQGRTTLVIAHRLYTIVNADRIYVIENGTVIESGNHSKLLLQERRYADFFRAQFRDQKEERFETTSSATKAPLDGQLIT